MSRRSIYELTIDELITFIEDKKMDTDPIKYRSNNKRTGAIKGAIKRSKKLLIRFILTHLDNGEIYMSGNYEIYLQEKKERKKEPAKEKKEKKEKKRELLIPEIKSEPVQIMTEAQIESMTNKKINETISKLEASIEKTEYIYREIRIFYILAVMYCIWSIWNTVLIYSIH